MKLKNSIELLQTTLENNIFSKSKIVADLKSHIDTLNIKGTYTVKRVRYDLWWSLSKDERDDIITLSIPRSEWLGGYADYSDFHLDTLLRKAIPLEYVS